MQENIKEKLDIIKSKLMELNSRYSKKTKIIVIAILVLVVVFAFVIAAVLNNKSYSTLFTNLNEQEAAQITAKLQESGIDFKYDGAGTIVVPEEQEQQLRATLLSEGYPKSGLTYDFFTSNVDIMSTDFEKNLYKKYALEEKMAGTIRLLDGVKDAVVTIALGNEMDSGSYALQDNKIESSASVVVTMENDEPPSAELVNAIQRLVSKGIPGMKTSDVVVVDGEGKEVTSSGEATQEGSARLKLSLEREIEDTTKARLLHLLKPLFGEDNVRVTVKTNLDIDKKMKEIINYIPATEDNKGVINKETTNREVINDGAGVGGTPGTETNAEIPIYPGITTDGTEIYYKDDQSFDYLVSQIKEQIESESGTTTNTAVSIVVDTKNLTARKTAELKNVVGRTAGIAPEITDQNVAIYNAPFYKAPTEQGPMTFAEFIKSKYGIMILCGAAAILLLAILIVVLLARRRRQDFDEEFGEDELPDEGVMDISLEDIRPSREAELRNSIKDFSDQNPEIAAQLIKSWLRGGDGSE